jgi:glutathione peroxidase
MKKLLVLTCSALFLSVVKIRQNKKLNKNKTKSLWKNKIFINLRLKIYQECIRFSKRKKVMIVNTASKCGLTPQYKDLEAFIKNTKTKAL